MDSEFKVIGFYVVFIIILNGLSIPYGQSIITNADFLNADVKNDYSGDIFATLGFLLFASVPATSNIANVLGIYRIIYALMVIPYTILISYIIVRLIRGGG